MALKRNFQKQGFYIQWLQKLPKSYSSFLLHSATATFDYLEVTCLLSTPTANCRQHRPTNETPNAHLYLTRNFEFLHR